MAPIFSQLQLAQPGRGYHSGGSMPMRLQPGELETDTLGRPYGWRRVHAVDATVLPSIPATTITLSVMANAHRIASAALAESV
jgi:choline dehydrogenase-like flavoprotein